MQAHKVEENENLKMTLREYDRKRTYSNRDSNWVNLLYSPSQVQQWLRLRNWWRMEAET